MQFLMTTADKGTEKSMVASEAKPEAKPRITKTKTTKTTSKTKAKATAEATIEATAGDKGAEIQKRLILITGDKGGTGKSTFGRALLDILLHRQIQCAAYDSDKRNSQLYRHYKDVGSGVKQIDITAKGGGDVLIDEMEQGTATVMLVDLPAGAGEYLETFEREMGFVAAANEMGYGVTMVSILSRVKDSVNALRLLLDFTGDSVDHLVIKNLYFGEPSRFALFDQSNTMKQLSQLGGRVLNMDDLLDDTYELIDHQSLTFRFAGGTDSPLPRSHRTRTYHWLSRFETEMEQVGSWLGIAP
jgi:energy-coupling factor transporter ATP-binding protein EcfA2